MRRSEPFGVIGHERFGIFDFSGGERNEEKLDYGGNRGRLIKVGREEFNLKRG